MCDNCAAHILGPGEVAGKVARSRLGRRALFWGFCIPMLPFAVVGVFGWWTIAIVALAAVGSAAGLLVMRRLHRHAVVVRPEPTPEMRAMLAARGLRPIPAPGQARPALPRATPRSIAMPRGLSITRKRRQALPAAAKAIEPTRVIPAAKAVPVARRRVEPTR